MTPTLGNGDAVGNDVIGMHKALLENGYSSTIYAESNLSDQKCSHYKKLDTEDLDLFIYHHSIGSDGVQYLNKFKSVTKYHNITPPEFIKDLNLVEKCIQGYNQIKEIKKYPIWCDSQYNAKTINLDKYEVLAPFNHIQKLLNTKPCLKTKEKLNSDWNILYVGRIVENKNQMLALKAFKKFNNVYKNSKLILCGPISSSSYYASILDYSNNKVITTGTVSDEALKSLYLLSNCFLTTSVHEGFCVPAIEAMVFGLPIVNCNNEAIVGTVGDNSIICDYTEDSLFNALEDVYLNKINKTRQAFEFYEKNYSEEIIKQKFLTLVKCLVGD
mgnify:CR=1 FL=1